MSPATLSAPLRLSFDNPWPGLESFHEEDQDFFNGRGDAARELLWLVQGERLTVLYGVSGLGKSSLLQAGLFPELHEKRMLPVYVRLVHAEGAPPHRVQVLDALRAAARARELEVPELDANATLWENFHRRGARFWTPDNLPVTPVLVLDQFEEAFPRQGRWTAALAGKTAEFLRELADLVEGRVPAAVRARLDADPRLAEGFAFTQHPYRVLISLREDFLADLEALRSIMPSVAGNRMRLTPLSGEAALQVTAAGGEELVPPQVGELIVRLVSPAAEENLPLAERTVDPALLSLFCHELNEYRTARELASITEELVRENGGSILAGFYERSLEGLPREVRYMVEDRLLTENGMFRDSEALDNVLAMKGVTEQAIDELVRRRLIRREERAGQARIELTHDVLTGVVRESRDRRRRREEEEKARAEMRAEREAARVRMRRWTVIVGLFFLLGLMTFAFGLRAVRSERKAVQSARHALDREREALLQAELTTELLRVDDERAQRDSAAATAARSIKAAARRGAKGM